MKQSAMYLLVIGMVCRLRAWFLLGGGVGAMQFDAGESEEAMLKKLELMAGVLAESNRWAGISWFFFIAGLVMLFGPMLFKSIRRSSGGMQKLEARHHGRRSRR
jgi:hypothetical protein